CERLQKCEEHADLANFDCRIYLASIRNGFQTDSEPRRLLPFKGEGAREWRGRRGSLLTTVLDSRSGIRSISSSSMDLERGHHPDTGSRGRPLRDAFSCLPVAPRIHALRSRLRPIGSWC